VEKFANFRVSSAPHSFERIYEIIDDIVSHVGLTGRDRFRFALCITEAFTNACVHGNRNDPEKKVSLSFGTEGECLIAEIEDDGAGKTADIPQSFGLEQIKSDKFSGRGVAIMNEFADKFSVAEKSNGGLKVCLEWDLTGRLSHLDSLKSG
jgi:serine/threonine-protein kinase RsbW